MNHIRFVMIACALAASATALASPVVVQNVVRLTVAPTMPVTGTVHSQRELQVTAGVDGRIEFVAEPGTTVKAGDALMRIDTHALELRRAELQAQADRARAQLRFLDAQLARQQGLASTRALSVNDLDQTRSERDVAGSDLRIAEVRLLQVADELRRATVLADFDGVVIERLHDTGEDVGRGSVVARVIDLGRLEVRVPTPNQHSGRIAVDDNLRVRGFGHDALARVRSVVPGIDPRRQAFELHLDLPAAAEGRQWTVGELVSVDLPVLAPVGSLAVPQDALVLRQEGTFVFRIGEDGIAERIAVETGASHEGYIAVSGGLQPGDRVVVRGGETLASGQRVTIQG